MKETRLKKTLAICLAMTPSIAFGGDDSSDTNQNDQMQTSATLESSFQISMASARVQVAYEVKRDAEGYLAGSEMTRALSLKLEQLHAEYPDLESDELVERALDEADAVLAAAQIDQAAE